MKRPLELLGAAAFGALALFVYADPIPYTGACFQPDRSARSMCHQAIAILSFQSHLHAVLSDPRRLVREGPDLLKAVEVLIQRGVPLQMLGVDPEQLKHEIERALQDFKGESV